MSLREYLISDICEREDKTVQQFLIRVIKTNDNLILDKTRNNDYTFISDSLSMVEIKLQQFLSISLLFWILFWWLWTMKGENQH